MKKLIIITGILLISCVVISVLASPAPAGSPADTLSQEERRFTLTEEHGRLVVYREGEDGPFLTTDTFVDTLPKSDRQAIEEGITVTGTTRLRKLMEDYCS